MRKFLLTMVCLLFVPCAFAQVNVEMEGMEYETRADGTFLIAGPTFFFDRILGAGGVHSESELWSSSKLRDRLLLNRMSGTPSWTPLAAGIWMKTGNELGDMIYQNFNDTQHESGIGNRTPILEGGFTTPSFKGFWATARLFQDDHFSDRTGAVRKKQVDDSFAFFGENWPFFSTAYGGLGFTNSFVNASLLAGEEYLWYYSESNMWIPVHYKPRVEGRLDLGHLFMTVTYQDGFYQNNWDKEEGHRREVDYSAKYSCGEFCRNSVIGYSVGIAYRAVDDSGYVYSKLKDGQVYFPFIEFRLQPVSRLTVDVMFGINDRDWLVQDSTQYGISAFQNFGTIIGIKNISGSRLNPLADTKEFYKNHTIDLTANGQMNLIQGYAILADTIGNVVLGGKGSYWAEHGAETFEVDGYDVFKIKNEKGETRSIDTRYGNVSRIEDWINGVTGELWMDFGYKDMFKFNASAGFEQISGIIEKAEVEPVEFFVGFTGDWLINGSFRISHSIKYRSDAGWNLRTQDPLTVKGDWYWDATFEQQFPKYGIFLSGTLLHVLADEVVEVPNGGYDRLRFICTAKKMF